MKKELADYLNGETEKLKAKQRKRKTLPVVLTHNQLHTLLDSLQGRYEFLCDFTGPDVRAERKHVIRLWHRVEKAYVR